MIRVTDRARNGFNSQLNTSLLNLKRCQQHSHTRYNLQVRYHSHKKEVLFQDKYRKNTKGGAVYCIVYTPLEYVKTKTERIIPEEQVSKYHQLARCQQKVSDATS